MRLSTDNIRTELALLDFRFPGFAFDLYEHPYEGLWVSIRHSPVNTYRPGELQPQCVRSPLPPFQNATQFHDWMIWRLARIAVHEVREAYWVAGAIYDDPHAPEANDGGARLH